MARRQARALSAGVFLLAPFAFPWPVGAQQGADFFTVTPCRVYDSRWGQGPLAGGFDRHIPIGGYCGIPPDASAASFNFTVINPSGAGLLSAYPCCYGSQNTVQSAQDGRTLAGNAVLGLGADGKIGAFLSAPFSTTADLAIDVSGYFRPPAAVQQWREWEATLISPEDYTLNDGDPYSEVELDVRFTNAATGITFLQPAFWDGEEGDPRTFKVRAAFPPGTWTWQIASCTRNGVSCLAGWAPSQGSIFVQSNTATGNPLYDRGFVKQFETMSGGEVVTLSHLAFPDGEHFAWVGDTAWAAPPREIWGQTSSWNAYLDDRKSKGFNLIQIAPAVAWKPKTGENWRALPDASGFSFKPKTKGCPDPSKPSPIPSSDCWTPRKVYWNRFTDMVRKAHEKGMVVALVGMMNPTGIAADSAYPSNLHAFVHDLTGRLGAFDVIYSPAFDDDRRLTVAGQNRGDLMNAVGNLLNQHVKPRPDGVRPLTNHLAGGRSNCDDYRFFATATPRWMTYYLFQSGHGGSSVYAGACAPTGTTDVERAIERARVMPLTLDAYANPALPAVNAEGPYDSTDYSTPHPNVDTRYRNRQAAYVGALSNAGGYSNGAVGLSLWDQPGGNFADEIQRYYTLPSSTDMRHFGSNVRGRELVAHHEWIQNNPTAQRFRQVLATDEVGFIMAYLPGDEPAPPDGPRVARDRIDIDATKLPCQVCPSQNAAPWSFTWVNPVSNAISQPGPTGGSCSGPSGGQMTFTRPACVASNANCDWVLKIERTGGCPSGGTAALSALEASSNAAGSGGSALEVWSDDSAGDGTSAIYAATHGGTVRGEPILLSPSGRAFQTSPRVDRVGSKQLVIWQADGLDGSLFGIYGALIGPQGEVEGPFKINHYTEHDQREPAVVGGVGGDALVVWSSYEQDGAQGGIYGRFVHTTRPSGNVPQDYLGEEFQIAEITAGHQQHPQMMRDAGGFWVAWETVDSNGLRSALSVRRLGLDGRPQAREVRLPAPVGEQSRLLTLDSPMPGSVVLHWWGQDARGGLSRHLQQVVGPEGPLGPVTTGER